MTIKHTATGREGVSWTNEEIEAHRQHKLAQVRADEAKDKQEAWNEYLEEHGSKKEYVKFEAEYDKDKTHLRDLEPADSHSQYYSLGAIEMVMDMAEKLMNDPVVFNHPEYYRSAHNAHTHLFNLAQLVGLDWFDMNKDTTKDESDDSFV